MDTRRPLLVSAASYHYASPSFSLDIQSSDDATLVMHYVHVPSCQYYMVSCVSTFGHLSLRMYDLFSKLE